MTDVSTTVNAITVTDAGTAVTVDIGTWPAAHAATHGAAGYDPVTVAESQVTGLTSALAAKAPLASPTFTGTVVLPSTTSIGSVDATEIGYLDGVTSAVQTQLNAKAPAASPTFTGVVAVPAGSASAPSIVPDGDTNTGIYSPGADQLAIATAGTARVYVNSSGDVGVGTTSPAGKLHVSSATGASILFYGDSTTNFIGKRASADGTSVEMFLDKARGSLSSQAVVSSGDFLGRIRFRGFDGGSFQNAAEIRAVVDATPGSGDMPGALSFFTTPDGSSTLSERMKIDNAGLITGSGTSLGAWTAYTPTLGGTGWAIGDGTIAGGYVRIGKIVAFQILVTFGASSTYGAASPTLTVPLAMSGNAQSIPSFVTNMRDASASKIYLGTTIAGSSTTVIPCQAGTIGELTGATSTVPFTWATSDYIRIHGVYETSA